MVRLIIHRQWKQILLLLLFKDTNMAKSKHHKKKRPNSIWIKQQGKRRSYTQWFNGKKRTKNRSGTSLIQGLKNNIRKKG